MSATIGEQSEVKKATEVKAVAEPKKSVLDTLDNFSEVHKTETPERTENRGVGNRGGKAKMKGVSAAVEAINARLQKSGEIRGNAPIDNKGPGKSPSKYESSDPRLLTISQDTGAYHATLPINDIPQRARWAITNRHNTIKILESTGVSITTKGNHIPAGEEPPPGQAKLTLLVEGETENAVKAAIQEIIRLRNEAIIAVSESEARAPVSGRYSVL